MEESLIIELEKPRFETRGLIIAGTRRSHVGSEAVFADMERQATETAARFSEVPDRVGSATWTGFFDMFSDGPDFEMLFGVETENPSGPPADFVRLTLPSQRYAIFPHLHSRDLMRNTAHTVWFKWLPASGLKSLSDGSTMLEFVEVLDGDRKEIWFPVTG